MESLPNLIIRKIAPVHRDGLRAILGSDATFRPDEIAVAMELIDDALANGDENYWVRVAETDSGIVGYVCFGPTPMTDGTFDLYWIVTDAHSRGLGVAAHLVRSMEQEVSEHGGKAIRVETSQGAGYQAARRFYQKLHYPVKARFEDFYRVGDDLIVYYKRL